MRSFYSTLYVLTTIGVAIALYVGHQDPVALLSITSTKLRGGSATKITLREINSHRSSLLPYVRHLPWPLSRTQSAIFCSREPRSPGEQASDDRSQLTIQGAVTHQDVGPDIRSLEQSVIKPFWHSILQSPTKHTFDNAAERSGKHTIEEHRVTGSESMAMNTVKADRFQLVEASIFRRSPVRRAGSEKSTTLSSNSRINGRQASDGVSSGAQVKISTGTQDLQQTKTPATKGRRKSSRGFPNMQSQPSDKTARTSRSPDRIIRPQSEARGRKADPSPSRSLSTARRKLEGLNLSKASSTKPKAPQIGTGDQEEKHYSDKSPKAIKQNPSLATAAVGAWGPARVHLADTGPKTERGIPADRFESTGVAHRQQAIAGGRSGPGGLMVASATGDQVRLAVIPDSANGQAFIQVTSNAANYAELLPPGLSAETWTQGVPHDPNVTGFARLVGSGTIEATANRGTRERTPSSR